MVNLTLHEFHRRLGAEFTSVSGTEVVAHYGDPLAEHRALCETAGLFDLSFRGRLCLLGPDRVSFLHGQVTNDVKGLAAGEGCYAALITAKGRMQSDLNVYRLAEELLLEFEPGLAETVTQRLEKYIIAEDVQVVDAAPHYGSLSVQGPRAKAIVGALGLPLDPPVKPFASATTADEALGEIYLVNQPRLGASGFDLYVPTAALSVIAERIAKAAASLGGRPCGWQAFELARIEAGIPRFGADLDETNLPPEAGLDARAMSYTKGCYIGQEVIARIRTYGQVARSLRGLRLADELERLPVRGDKLLTNGKEVGYITSAARSPRLRANIALGYVRKERNELGAELELQTEEGTSKAVVVELPFVRADRP